MKANELMIGDWVLDTNTKTNKKVAEICDDDIIGFTNTEEPMMYDTTFADKLEPIPLTSEILEKNGFLANRHVYPYPYYEYEVKEIKEKVGFAFPQGNRTSYKKPWVCIDTEFVYIEHLPCMFVNQLQHALRLSKIEKEIIL